MQELHKQARTQLLICKQNLQAKVEQLKPLREARDEQNKARAALKTSGGEVAVRSEEELDARLHHLNHRQQHESLSAVEEKRLLQEIKTLQVLPCLSGPSVHARIRCAAGRYKPGT